ncbi:MAG: hypothetical protein HFJ40_08230 [Clostridia bacterium]|nr:hypothetical protein [Clostridia bacterium]
MSFIGIISDNKSFENIRKKILENIKDSKLNIININRQSIENIQNIKFKIIVIDNNLEKFKNQKSTLQKICKNTQYIILNTDIHLKMEILQNEKVNIITYGLNQKATITMSSIKETDILISLQRNIENIKKEIIEVEEKHIKLNEKDKLKAYEILIIYTILIIYGYKIINQI